MPKYTFEDYLWKLFVSDGDSPESFDVWLCNIPTYTLIQHGEIYGLEMQKMAIEYCKKLVETKKPR